MAQISNMKLRRNLYALVLVLSSVSATYFVTASTAQQGSGVAQAPAADNEYQVGGVLYMQKAGEYRALAYQAFNIARWRLDLDLKGKTKDEIPKPERKKPRAIM